MGRKRQLDAANHADRVVLADESNQTLDAVHGQSLTRECGPLQGLEEVVDANLLEKKAPAIEHLFALTDHVIPNRQFLVGHGTTMAVTNGENLELP